MGMFEKMKSLLASLRTETPVDSMFLKQLPDGSLRWAAVYSNSFRDDDNPPEIISAESHREYVKAVDAGLTDPPVLQIWHEPSLTVGSADWVAYSEVSEDKVFAVAGGAIHPEAEELVKSLVAAFGDELVLSHGFYALERSKEDSSVITNHLTEEITLLPRYAAANKLTFPVIYQQEKETTMIPTYKRTALEAAGVDASLLDRIDGSVNAAAKNGTEQDRESKETSDAVTSGSVTEPEATEPVAQAEPAPVETDAVTNQQIVETLLTVVEEVKALKSDVIALKSAPEKEEEATEEQKERTPIMAQLSAALSDLSVVGKEEAAIDGRVSLAKDAPVEEEAGKESKGLFFNEWSQPTTRVQ